MDNKKLISILIACGLSLTAFLSKTWFDGVNANAQELAKLKMDDVAHWTELHEKVREHDEYFANLFKKLDVMEQKEDRIIRDSRPYKAQ